jgi:hypothetical protein
MKYFSPLLWCMMGVLMAAGTARADNGGAAAGKSASNPATTTESTATAPSMGRTSSPAQNALSEFKTPTPPETPASAASGHSPLTLGGASTPPSETGPKKVSDETEQARQTLAALQKMVDAASAGDAEDPASVAPDFQLHSGTEDLTFPAATSDGSDATRQAAEQLAEAQRMANAAMAQAAGSSSGSTSESGGSRSSSSSTLTHHSMNELAISTHLLRPDLSDPTHHSMSALSYGHLGPDPSDPNHHTMDDLP